MTAKRITRFLIGLLMVGPALMNTESTRVYAQSTEDMMEMSLDDLLNLEVSSVSKKAERLQDVASSLYVLTEDDIKSSGATSLHEVLMTVPGYWGIQDEYSHVAPVIRNSPAVNGNRGTVLYLLDGTPILDNMASSFSFHNFDIPLDEVQRIEVIRGSGGTVYGANSATGVVNIFTKSPKNSDGLSLRVDGASPTYGNFTARAGGQVNDRLVASVYAKVRKFDGYGVLPEFQGETIEVPNGETGNDTLITNRFSSDFETSTMYSGGAKAAYQLGENTEMSFGGHYNSAAQTTYTNYDTELSLIHGQDVLVENDINRNRFVGNVRYDHRFNDNHSLFARVSTNVENDFLNLLGGYKVRNSIVDIEAQDNFPVGTLHDFSLGVNYRIVSFDIHDVNAVDAVRYLDPNNKESLSGGFVQDKIKLLDGKVNLLLGLKAENYKLLDDDYYLSPMAKFSFVPSRDFTLWGGFTQSYTTPGYNNTNIDLLLLQTLSDETVFGMATQGVYDNVYQQAYDGVLAAGGDAGTADATATAAATAFVASEAGQAAITAAAGGIRAGLPDNVGVINGNKTVPTRFQTFELGFRANLEKRYSFESNLYYSNITDGIAASAAPILDDTESPVVAGQSVDYYLYGNYIKGTTYGVESMFRFVPSKGTKFEVAHSYTHSEWEYQENDEFDISLLSPSEIDNTPETSVMPKHLWKVRGMFRVPGEIGMNVGLIHATEYSSQSNYDYIRQRYPSLLAATGTEVATDGARTIVNVRLEKMLMDDRLTAFAFGNDVFNKGRVVSTNPLGNTTLSKIGAKFGLGMSLDI
ncbi:MAG: TonB-dependent receptor plug domain-containing protein [candidate division Zixibacteria bacterium]|nr:TonB-dependent receptor plug domain-containing protein [candidate division Zixibacteria bacterium]MDH3936561.1 TonB-dependent receptor plug domain-containing protein [candidate division Zixibacteria bacterium]MDH4033147.1 TonB-dependent receptor plug domain-containing protein [candidate division Zixibacteria bacterium]